MRADKKKISLKAAAPVLEKLNEDDEDTVSLGKFAAIHSENLSRSGKNLREIYEHLKANGLDVGKYHSFRSACYRAGLRQRRPKEPAKPELRKNLPEKAQAKAPELPKISAPLSTDKPTELSKKKESGARISKYNPLLPPVLLPGGVEALIDPETGAKGFEIE